MKFLLSLVLFLSVNADAAIFIPYGLFTRTAFIVGEGSSEDIAKKDARMNVPKGFQGSTLISSPVVDCVTDAGKCKYYLPLEPSAKNELASYKKIIEHHGQGTLFSGYGRTMEDAEKDLLLKTGKKSLSAFVGNVTWYCPIGFKGSGSDKCDNRDEAGNFIAETSLPRICFLTE